MSLSGAAAYRWDGKRSGFFLRTRTGTFNTDSLISFLKDLRRHMSRKKVILIWDGLPAHKSRRMKEYIGEQKHWLTVVPLPSYAPELNPVEGIWGNLKGQELANYCADDLGALASRVRAGGKRIQKRKDLLIALLNHAGLFF